MEKSISVSFDQNIGSGPLISVGIFRLKFVAPFLTNWFCVLIREFGRGLKRGKSHSYWLAWFNRKMLFHFPQVFPLISSGPVSLAFYDNGKHPESVSTPPWMRSYP